MTTAFPIPEDRSRRPRPTLDATCTPGPAEFTNISYRALAELCRDAEVAEELAVKAKADSGFLVDLGTVLIQYHQFTLESALEQAVGRPWRKSYQSGDGLIPCAAFDADRLASRMMTALRGLGLLVWKEGLPTSDNSRSAGALNSRATRMSRSTVSMSGSVKLSLSVR